MRRTQTSVVVTTAIFGLMSVAYIVWPNDPISGVLAESIFGIDNRLSGRQSSPAENPEATNRIAELESENQRLRQELGFEVYAQHETIAATVVSKNAQNYRSTIDIDRGSDAGLEVGQSVLSRGQLIGRVVDVSSNRARVLTLSDPDFRAAAIIDGTNAEGLVRHVPGGAVLEQVPDGTRFDDGTYRVVTSGLGGVFPPGLLLGELGDDVSPPNAIFREYVLHATVDSATVREVVVIK